MATKIPIPLTGMEIDAGDPQGAAMTFVLAVVGFAALFFAQDLGQSTKQTISEAVGLGSDGQSPDVL